MDKPLHADDAKWYLLHLDMVSIAVTTRNWWAGTKIGGNAKLTYYCLINIHLYLRALMEPDWKFNATHCFWPLPPPSGREWKHMHFPFANDFRFKKFLFHKLKSKKSDEFVVFIPGPQCKPDARLPFSLKCHWSAGWNIKCNTHIHMHTHSHYYKWMALLLHAVFLCGLLQASSETLALTNLQYSNWAIMTLCNGIDSTVLGGGR